MIVLTVEEHAFVDSWTDEEWLSVINTLPPTASVADGLTHVWRMRQQAVEASGSPTGATE